MSEPPRSSLADSALARQNLRAHLHQTGSLPTYMPIRNGTATAYSNRASLVRAFHAISESDRGYLYNASPGAIRGRVRGPDRRPSAIDGIVDFISDITQPPDFHIFLVEQVPIGISLWMGYGMARRSTTSTPPSQPVPGHVNAAGMQRGARPNAFGVFLDVSQSMGIQIRDRQHHVVIICTPPEESDTQPYHCVFFRPLIGNSASNLRLGEWTLMPINAARQYLTL